MIWTSTGFKGYWPVGTAAVVRANTEDEAQTILAAELAKLGLPQSEPPRVKPFTGECAILCDGNY